MTYDPRALHEALRRHGVRYVLVGDQAARVVGGPVAGIDVDICPDTGGGNAAALAGALADLGATERAPGAYDTPFGPLDVIAMPAGTAGYADLVAGARRYDIGGVEVDVAALDDVIRMKRATGRPKDRIEVEVLVALRDEITDSS